MIHAFIYGVILAFGLIIPLGVQNIFIFNQGAAQKHFLHALPSVLTAALCDAILIMLAVLGVSMAVLSIAWLKIAVFIIGCFFLLYMGWATWQSKPARLEGDQKPLSARRQMAFAASVSLLNPHAIIDTVGVIGTSAVNFQGSERWAYTMACIVVSCCWFFGLSIAGHTLHKIDKTGRGLAWINKISALIIWSIAAYIGLQLYFIWA
jgi:L-lysine exporter family protein LysE/ArgO